MKKQYIAPAVEIITISREVICAKILIKYVTMSCCGIFFMP